MSQQTAETSDAYTVVVFRGSSSKPLRFSFPRKFVRKLLILAVVLIVADLLVISHYVIRTGEVWQLSAFRAEAMSAREQTAAFSSARDLHRKAQPLARARRRGDAAARGGRTASQDPLCHPAQGAPAVLRAVRQ